MTFFSMAAKSGLSARSSARLRTEEQKRTWNFSPPSSGMSCAKCSAEVLALQCHFLAGRVLRSNSQEPSLEEDSRELIKSINCL